MNWEPHRRAFIGLGSNEGDRISHIAEAIRRIGDLPGVRFLSVSSLYETSPLGMTGGLFLNAVAAVETDEDPRRLLSDLHGIEETMGRTREGVAPASRNIDIDLLLFGEEMVRDENLTLPHPGMSSRRFVLEPLAELDPALEIPGTGMTAGDAAARLRGNCPGQEVRRVGHLEEILDRRHRGGEGGRP